MAKIHLEDIENSITLQTHKKSSNIIEGGFRSLYHGKSMDFDDLREYTYGDDVEDIDWKASSRTGTTLVRKNTAEKRHFFLIIPDNGIKMDGETSKRIIKKDLCTKIIGITSKIAKRSEVDFALLYESNSGIELTPFQTSDEHIENILNAYQDTVIQTNTKTIASLLRHSLENIQKRMMVLVISDSTGIDEIEEKLINECEEKNDLFFISLNDAKLTEGNTFDLDSNDYFHNGYLTSSYLKEIEDAARNDKQQLITKKINSTNARIIFVDDDESFYNQLDDLFIKDEV